MGIHDPSSTRRKVLKRIGTSSIVGVGFANTASASNSGQYSGFVYDPTSFEIKGEVTGEFNSSSRKLIGELSVKGYKFNMGGPSTMGSPSPQRVTDHGDHISRCFRSTEDLREEYEEDYRRKVELTDTGSGWLSGYVRTPTSLERDGIVLVNNSERSRSEAEAFLNELHGGE